MGLAQSDESELAGVLGSVDLHAERLWPSVLPLFRKEPREQPLIEGSGVLVQIESEFFVFTAGHVLQHFAGTMIATEHAGRTVDLRGESFYTPPEELTVDAGIVRITGEVPSGFSDRAIKRSQLDPYGDQKCTRCLLLGYPFKKTKAWKGFITSKRKAVASTKVQAEVYRSLGCDQGLHLLLDWNGHWTSSEGIHDAWSMKGASGGGMWNLDPHSDGSEAKLVATFTEIKPKKALLGTRVNVHLGLVAHSFPDLTTQLKDRSGD